MHLEIAVVGGREVKVLRERLGGVESVGGDHVAHEHVRARLDPLEVLELHAAVDLHHLDHVDADRHPLGREVAGVLEHVAEQLDRAEEVSDRDVKNCIVFRYCVDVQHIVFVRNGADLRVQVSPCEAKRLRRKRRAAKIVRRQNVANNAVHFLANDFVHHWLDAALRRTALARVDLEVLEDIHKRQLAYRRFRFLLARLAVLHHGYNAPQRLAAPRSASVPHEDRPAGVGAPACWVSFRKCPSRHTSRAPATKLCPSTSL